MDNIIVLVLTRGVIIVGEQVSDAEELDIILKKPFQLMPVGQNGQMSLVPYAQWVTKTDYEVMFNNVAIESISEPGELQAPYIQATTGIQLAPAGAGNVTPFRR